MTHTDRSVPETKGVDVASASIRPEPWQDIATAPKDGTVILIRISGGMPRVEAAFWNLNSGAQPDPEYPWTTLDGVHGTNGYGDDRPDAWMPLPPCEGSQANLADANKNARELAEARERADRYEHIANEHRSFIGQLKPALVAATLSRDEALEALRVERERVGVFRTALQDLCDAWDDKNDGGTYRGNVTKAQRAAHSVVAQGDETDA